MKILKGNIDIFIFMEKLLMALAVISVLGVTVTVARASDDFLRDRERQNDRGWQKGERHDEHHRSHRRDHRRPPVVEDRYYEPTPVYAPPVVVAPPPPPPGISIIFPIHFR